MTELDGIGRVLDELRGLLLGQLVIHLDRAFNDVELDELLFHLGLPADELAGHGRARTRARVEYVHRRGRLPELLAQAEWLQPGLVISGL